MFSETARKHTRYPDGRAKNGENSPSATPRSSNRLALLLLLAIARRAAGQEPPAAPAGGAPPGREQNLARVQQATDERAAREKDNPDVLVRRGLVADRRSKRVEILAEACTVGAADPVEFFLIGEKSGHGYEALAVSFASPADVYEGLCFIGMKPGVAVDPASVRFWPRGERVIVTFEADGAGAAPVRAERFILDRRTGKALPETGLVFTGSARRAAPGEPGRTVLDAEACEPHSIASAYNEPGTLLDVPCRAAQGEVYNQQKPDAELRFPPGRLLRVALESERKSGPPRVMELVLAARPAAGAAGSRIEDVVFDLREDAGAGPGSGLALTGVLERLTAACASGRDPFLTLDFDPALAVGAVRAVCSVIGSIEGESGVRVEPPKAGQLYYRAFLPNEAHRDRVKRMAQPWELRLAPGPDGTVAGVLSDIDEQWAANGSNPMIAATDVPVPTPEALRKALDERGPGLPVILVFCPPQLAYAELLRFLAPVLGTHPTIHVFVEGMPPLPSAIGVSP